MKKIFITGKIDDGMTALSKRLSGHFSVRFGSSVALAALTILETFKPDIIAARVSETDKSVFARIASAYSDRPVILIGSQDEAASIAGITPAAVCPDTEGVYDAVLGIIPAAGAEAPRASVMVVDDDPAMLRMMKIMLEDEYDLIPSPSGTKALKLLERIVPDVILLDYEMPDMNGVEVLEKLREDKRLAGIPVIFLTGVSNTAAFEAISRCGVSGHLVKPADAANIKAAVSSVLNK